MCPGLLSQISITAVQVVLLMMGLAGSFFIHLAPVDFPVSTAQGFR